MQTDAHSKKAWMQAARELCGLSQQDVADEADVSRTTVKRWERPDFSEPPEDVLFWLKTAVEEHENAVMEYVQEVTAQAKPDDTVSLRWYRTQAQRDAEGGADVPFMFSNAITRDVARELVKLGYTVTFEYPEKSRSPTEA